MVPVSTSRRHRKRKNHDTTTTSDDDAKWSNIGADLLEYIQKKLPLPDILRCRAVCSSWRSITKTHLSSSLNSPPPPLVLWRKESDDDEYESELDEELAAADDGHWGWGFFDVLKIDGGNLCLQNHKSEVLLAGMSDCVGYSNGYFLFLDKDNEETICLFHPTLFSGSLVRFPLIRCSEIVRIDGGVITRALLWDDPILGNASNGIALVHEGSRQLLFAKCGATRFTQFECQYSMCENESFIDTVCVDNCIYGLIERSYGGKHHIKGWDCSNSTVENHGVPKMVWDFEPKFSSTFEHTGHLRLVESQGELLLVAIARPEPRRIAKPRMGLSEGEAVCVVYKMDFEEKEWVRMSSLGDRVLFIMEFQAMSLSTHEFPQYQKNSVYFWHYFVAGRSFEDYLGIFNMDDGSLKVIDVEK